MRGSPIASCNACRSAASTSPTGNAAMAALATLRASDSAIPAASARTDSIWLLTDFIASRTASAASRVPDAMDSRARISAACAPSACASARMESISACVSTMRWRGRGVSAGASSPPPKTVSKVNFVVFLMTWPSVDQLVFALLAGDHDFTLVREVFGDVDHAHLRFVDVLQPHGSHGFHV